MFKALKAIGLALVAASLVSFAPVAPASAQSPAVSVAVPSPGGGGGGGGFGYPGCYSVTHTIYGPYNLSFCLNRGRGGSYRVTGGGLNCNGGLDWYDQGSGRVEIDLYRAPCGRGTDWTGDSLSCRNANYSPILGAFGNNVGVAVPATAFNKLNCTYRPASRGYSQVSVTAKRT